MAHSTRLMRALPWLIGLGLAFAPFRAHAAPPDADPTDPTEDADEADAPDDADAPDPDADAPDDADTPDPEADAPDDADTPAPETDAPGDADDADAPAPETDATEPETAADGDAPAEATETTDVEIVAEPEPEPEVEDDSHEDVGTHQPNPKIPPTGAAQLWYRSTTFVDYFGNNYNARSNDDGFFALVNFVNFGVDSRLGKKWTLSASARVDTHNVFNVKSQDLCDSAGDGTIDPNCEYGNDYRLERVQVRASHKLVEVTVGDFNANFGRGIPLSVRKIADIGIDATIKGGRFDLKLDDRLQLTALGGIMNRQQTDFATRILFRDPGYFDASQPSALCGNLPGLRQNRYGNRLLTLCSDAVAGGRFETKLPGKVRLGGHYVAFWFGELAGIQPEGMHLAGGDISRARIAKHWDLFAGVTGLFRNPQQSPRFGGDSPDLVENGIAAYLSNSLTFGRTFVLIEGKFYDNYVVAKDTNPTTIQYTKAPTLERADQIIPAAANTAGGRLLLEHTLDKSRVTLVANYLGYAFSLFNEIGMFGTHGEMVQHGYGGLRWRNIEKGSEIQAFAGYRWEGYHHPDQAPHDYDKPYTRKLPHAEFYVNQVVGKTKGMAHSLSLRLEWRYERQQKGSSKFFHRGNVILGYGLSPWLTLALIGGFSSEFTPLPNEPKLHDQPCEETETSQCTPKPHLWPGAEVRVNFFESSFLRIFAGRQVGGLLCVNGSCRQLPDFEGVRFDLVLSF